MCAGLSIPLRSFLLLFLSILQYLSSVFYFSYSFFSFSCKLFCFILFYLNWTCICIAAEQGKQPTMVRETLAKLKCKKCAIEIVFIKYLVQYLSIYVSIYYWVRLCSCMFMGTPCSCDVKYSCFFTLILYLFFAYLNKAHFQRDSNT